MADPTLTVAMPVKDGSNYIRDALDSILGQTFGNFKVVVAENASSDDTVDILAQYARLDRRLTYHTEPSPLGHTRNFNRAMRLCDTPWVKLICHDDMLRDDALEQIARATASADRHRAGLISNGVRLLFDDRLATPNITGSERVFIEGHRAIRDFLRGKDGTPMPSVSNCTVRREAWKRAGGFDERFLHQDIPAWMQVLTRNNLFHLPDTLSVTRIHPGQITHFSLRSGHSIHDFRIFLDEFFRCHGDKVGIDRATRLRARLRPLTAASIALQRLAVARDWQGAGQLLQHLPRHWLPLMPAIAVRATIREARREERIRRTLTPLRPELEGLRFLSGRTPG